MNLSPREKYAARIEELASLAEALRAGRKPEPGAAAGRALEAAGDLLRRRNALATQAETVLDALRQIPELALHAWATGVDVSDLRTRLIKAASDAVEAGLPDDPEAGAHFSGLAMQGLQARDRMESALVALEAMAGQGRGDAGVILGRLRGAIDDLDATCRTFVTSLTTLNPSRRPEAALLDEAVRLRAWWYSTRCGIDDDALVAVLGGEKKGTLPSRERRASDVVMEKRVRRVSFDDLLRFDLGLASPAERDAIQAAAEKDPELKLALAAMDEGDRAIEELEQGPQPPAPIPLPRAPRETPVLVEEHRDFKVLVLRTPRNVQVVVQPRHADRLAAAAVYRSDDAARPIAPNDGEHGLHFELGAPERLVGAGARVVVKLRDGQTHAIEVKF